MLLDAPCSSTGTVRRHPDVLWTKTPADIDKLAGLQARLLAALMLADDLADATASARAPGETDALAAIAGRLESLATSLEKSAASA